MMIRWIASILLILFIYHVREVFPPFVVGGIIAYILLPVVNSISSSLKIRPAIAVLIIYVIAAAALLIGCWLGGPVLVDQFENLVNQHEVIVTKLVEQISTGFNLHLDIERTSVLVLNSVGGSVGKPEEIVHIGGLISKSLLGVLVCIVSSVYFMIDAGRVGRFFLRFVPEEKHETVIKLSAQVNGMLSRYVRGQLILIVIMSTVAYAFLTLIFHFKYALLIAILSGFLEIIPVLGPIFAIGIATIVGVAHAGISIAPKIILCYWLARIAEDYVVVPRVIGHAVELHPLVVIFAVLCGEVMAGALGMLIAIPVAALIKEILDYIYPPTKTAEAKVDQEIKAVKEIDSKKNKKKL